MPKDRLTKERNLHELEGCYEACIRLPCFRTSKMNYYLSKMEKTEFFT